MGEIAMTRYEIDPVYGPLPKENGTYVVLSEGEFVARCETCDYCYNGRIIDEHGNEPCMWCHGTGRVAVPVEVGK